MTILSKQSISFQRIGAASLLIAGTAIGAGMLGIPLVTAGAGLGLALLITAAVWLFMLLTGLLVVEAALKAPPNSNFLSLSTHFLGWRGSAITGFFYLFLYYALLVAYIAGGAPLFATLCHSLFGITLSAQTAAISFSLLFSLFIFRGIFLINKLNSFLMAGLILSYIVLITLGFHYINPSFFTTAHSQGLFWAAPILFSAFGYHNVLPSLVSYLDRDRKSLYKAIFLGSFLTFIVYTMWQVVVIGSIPTETLLQAKKAGVPATFLLQHVLGSPFLSIAAALFAFFALITSLLGVGLAMCDFIQDGLRKTKASRILSTVLTMVPPTLIALWDPTLFNHALEVAGGFGEAFLNGLLPLLFIAAYRYKCKKEERLTPVETTSSLVMLGFISMAVMLIEACNLLLK